MHTRASFSAYGLSAAVVRPKGQGEISFSSSFSLGLILKTKKGEYETYLIQTQHIYDRCTEYT